MKTLINNIKLISFNYMNSNNNTINKSGIEYSYIALAMNNMLGFTNNNVKNINIDKTNAIAIDWTSNCILAISGEIVAAILLGIGIATSGGALLIVIVGLGAFGLMGGWMGTGYICGWPSQVSDPWFSGL